MDIAIGQVGGKKVGLRDALYCLKLTDRLDVFRHALDDVLLVEEVEEHGITISDGDLQVAADRLRRQMGLLTANATEAWLADRLLTIEDFEEYLRRSLATEQLKRAVVDGQVESYFADHRPAFDTASISRIVVTSSELAESLADMAKAGSASFAEAARSSIEPVPDGRVGPVRRMFMEPEVSDAVFSSAPGDVVGPIQVDSMFHIVRVDAIDRARLDEPTRRTIEDHLFQAWLADRRAAKGVSLDLAGLFG